MSILKKPYQLSIWEDVWDGDNKKFVEQRVAIIGTDTMESQSRALEPNLTTKINGEKKLTFKMYKQYIDTATGEKVDNPFVEQLISERKVKLNYKGQWFDFIVKNVDENSSTHLCTYQLEDALVQELSKNGFNIVLDEKERNNSGTAKELAEETLKETDWTVDSELFVQTLDEPLVYLTLTRDITATLLLDPTPEAGVEEDKNAYIIPAGRKVLGFYSSCTNKPVRFQFLYVPNLANVKLDENRVILEENCQYYIDYYSPDKVYKSTNNGYDFFLPEGFATTTAKEEGVDNVVISSLYRGRRYVFSQESEFIPVLNRYVNKYIKKSSQEVVYGYQNTEYKSPALVQNVITNSQFKNTSGWIGTRDSEGTNSRATVESVYGYFDGGVFVNALEELKQGTYPKQGKTYTTYLKLVFTGQSDIVVNSGPYDNRITIGNMELGEKWALKLTCLNSKGANAALACSLQECKYDSNTQGYTSNSSNILFSEFGGEGEYKISKVDENKYSTDGFKKNSQVRLVLSRPSSASTPATYYLQDIQLFRASYTDTGNLITPETQLSNLNQVAERIIETTYYYFSPNELDKIDNADQLTFLSTSKTLNYDIYRPKFVANAQKIRSVSAKESNYFNILQSIAETFECWLTFEIERENDGGITTKKVFFKNYIDNPNYAGFRYGVNLKNIKRTYESKKIVSKLVVKPNSNEFAESGFCTIARAGANPTGENYLYDFQYYFNTGMLNARQFLDTLYVIDDEAAGPDIEGSTGFNLQGYFVRIKSLNNLIDAKTNIFLQLSQDLTQYKAKQEVANAGYEAAVSGLQQTEEDFYRATGGKVLGNNVLDQGLAERSDIKKLLSDYFVYKQEKERYHVEKDWYDQVVTAAKKDYDNLLEEITDLTEYKRILNQKFFSTYSRYIQEGTWIDEKYVDDELYYIDAQSVMYNSCYPQVAYSIDVIEVSVLPGLEDFAYSLGDKTYVEDAEFFGEEGRAEVIVTEVTEDLDDPTKNKIKVQNFKSQFQDLFQKITATVQQAQYNSGSYEKAVALAEANQERKQQFFTDALDSATARLTTAGQQSVTWGNDGITVKSVNSPCDAIRMVGGAILLSKQDKNGEQKWVTGVTSDGISASLITAGMLNAAEIAIMNYDEPVFRWDAFGISAYEATWQEADFGTVISEIDTTKFVRFDKFGIYGINSAKDAKDVKDGLTWHPNNIDEIHSAAAFALTWDGLKVTGTEVETGTETKIKVVAHIGKQDDNIINITKGTSSIFKVTNSGNVEMTGTITATGGKIAGWLIDEDYGISSKDYTVGIVDPFAGAEAFNRPSLISGNSKIVYYAGSFDPALSSNSKKIPAFTVLADGSLYASAAQITGTITAKEGYIGGENGWVIDTNEISSTKNNTGSIVLSSASHSSDYWINATDKGKNTKFSVQKNGKMYAQDADIAGKITATEGEIAGWTISRLFSDKEVILAGLTYGTLGDSDGFHMYAVNSSKGQLFGATESQSWALGIGTSFGVTKAGSLYAIGANIIGKITATGGRIGNWNIGTSYISSVANNQGNFYLYSAESTSNYWIFCQKKNDTSSSYKRVFSITKTGQLYSSEAEITGKLTSGPGSSLGGWTVSTPNGYVFGNLSNKTFTFTESGVEKTWYYGIGFDTNAVGTTNRAFAIGVLQGIEETSRWDKANFYITGQGKLVATNVDIAGKITAKTGGKIGGFDITVDKLSTDTGYGIYVKNKEEGVGAGYFYDGISFFKIGDTVEKATMLYLPSGNRVQLSGTWHYTNGNITSSWRNAKHDIEQLDDRYSALFDNLNPIRFKYNDGTSGRYHTGLILDDLKTAMDVAGIDSQEFAAYCVFDPGTGEGGIRYDAFISLNTWQIQKLKPRMTAAEKEIASLKLEVQQLREELAALKQ